MKQKIFQAVLIIIVIGLFVFLMNFIIGIDSKNIKSYPYRIKVDNHIWNTKGIDSTVNNKIYFIDSYDKHIVVEGKYIIEER